MQEHVLRLKPILDEDSQFFKEVSTVLGASKDKPELSSQEVIERLNSPLPSITKLQIITAITAAIVRMQTATASITNNSSILPIQTRLEQLQAAQKIWETDYQLTSAPQPGFEHHPLEKLKELLAQQRAQLASINSVIEKVVSEKQELLAEKQEIADKIEVQTQALIPESQDKLSVDDQLQLKENLKYADFAEKIRIAAQMVPKKQLKILQKIEDKNSELNKDLEIYQAKTLDIQEAEQKLEILKQAKARKEFEIGRVQNQIQTREYYETNAAGSSLGSTPTLTPAAVATKREEAPDRNNMVSPSDLYVFSGEGHAGLPPKWIDKMMQPEFSAGRLTKEEEEEEAQRSAGMRR